MHQQYRKPIRLSFTQLSLAASFFLLFTRAAACDRSRPEEPIQNTPLTTAENCQYTLERGRMLQIDGPPCSNRKFITAEHARDRDYVELTRKPDRFEGPLSSAFEHLLWPSCVNELGEKTFYDSRCKLLSFSSFSEYWFTVSSIFLSANGILTLFAPVDTPLAVHTFYYDYIAPSPIEERTELVGRGSFRVRITPTENPTRIVEVTIQGQGVVTSEPEGIHCSGSEGANCRISLAPKEGFVTLKATPSPAHQNNNLPHLTEVTWEFDCAHGDNNREVKVPLNDYVRCNVIFKEEE